MKIEILGMGCAKCKQLMANAEKAVKETGVQAEVVKVEDMNQIVGYGIMTTPAIVIDGEVKAAGKVLTVEQIKKLIV
ncbi:MAG: TM0996/MTH895 family glutaredoxin-like protein [Candidatus Omnitrophica bacterium]|nr:TM0996/MTH895 family glutaredoxin-like protein [Candidatus Omnitrophota bacterium]